MPSPHLDQGKFRKYIFFRSKGFKDREIMKKMQIGEQTAVRYKKMLKDMSEIEFGILIRGVAHEV